MSNIISRWIAHNFPREVVSPVVLVFSIENVVDRIFAMFVPPKWAFVGWLIIAVVGVAGVVWWGATDDEEPFETADEDDADD